MKGADDPAAGEATVPAPDLHYIGEPRSACSRIELDDALHGRPAVRLAAHGRRLADLSTVGERPKPPRNCHLFGYRIDRHLHWVTVR